MNTSFGTKQNFNGKPYFGIPTDEDLRWDSPPTKIRKIHLEGLEGKFIRSMSFEWFSLAAKLPGRVAPIVGVAIWLEYGFAEKKYGGLLKVPAIQLQNGKLRKYFNINPKAKRRALRQLEKAGLIKLHQRGKQSVFITLVKVW
jgi:hypothetical protein